MFAFSVGHRKALCVSTKCDKYTCRDAKIRPVISSHSSSLMNGESLIDLLSTIKTESNVITVDETGDFTVELIYSSACSSKRLVDIAR